MSSTQTISLNGRRYDALTGRVVADSSNPHIPRVSSTKKLQGVRHPSHKSVDGIVKVSSKSLNQRKKHTPHAVAPHINRITQHSKTLMRDAVAKPDFIRIRQQPAIAKHHINKAVAKTVAVTAPARQNIQDRAQAIKNSEFIGKVSELTTPANPITPDPEVIQTSANSEVHLKNLDYLSNVEQGNVDPSVDLEAIFSEASLKLSDSHQPITNKELRFYDAIADRLRISVKLLFILSLTTFVILFSLISGLVFENNIKMFIADSATHIHGFMPTYAPPGFGLQSVNYATAKPTGTIDVTFANQDGLNYNIDEQAKSWDSQALVNNVVIPSVGNNFKTYQIGGRSVYIYNQTAVWVDAGIYYIMSNNARLTNDEINKIVNTT